EDVQRKLTRGSTAAHAIDWLAPAADPVDRASRTPRSIDRLPPTASRSVTYAAMWFACRVDPAAGIRGTQTRAEVPYTDSATTAAGRKSEVDVDRANVSPASSAWPRISRGAKRIRPSDRAVV